MHFMESWDGRRVDQIDKVCFCILFEKILSDQALNLKCMQLFLTHILLNFIICFSNRTKATITELRRLFI
jgi:hypothetical protein